MTEKEMRPIKNAEKKQKALLRLLAVVAALRAPDGCPWDRAQTSKSFLGPFLEEAYEMIDAVENGAPEDVCEEAGDVLLHALMQAQVFEEQGLFDIGDVAEAEADKLVNRHPHVFGSLKVKNTEEILVNWEAIKKKEKASKRHSVLDGVPKTLPALAQAEAIHRKAAKQGFDWPNIEEVWQKVQEEETELKEAQKEGNTSHIAEEFGDLLAALVNLARFLKIDPEQALRQANDKFRRRFQFLEAKAKEEGREINALSLEEMDKLWNEAKKAGL